MLSAQCTDERVNKTTPILFKKCKTIDDFKNIDQYIQTRLLATYQDFITFVKPRMTKRKTKKINRVQV